MGQLSVATDFYTSLVSTSLWLSDQEAFNGDILRSLADHFGTETFAGNTKDPEYVAAMQDWLNKATDNKLKSAEPIGFKDLSVMNVISTVLFKALWNDEFNRSKTRPGTFYGPEGPVEVSYMYQEGSEIISFGKNYTALSKLLSFGNHAIFILPNEGYTPEDLIANGEVFELSSARNEQYIVREKIPRFDITGSYDISKGLSKLGIKDIFSEALADFHRTVNAAVNVYISSIEHKCRLKIDERGCEGAAQTIAYAVAAGMGPDEEYDFILDRPFIVIIRSSNYCPLFLGVVNRPC